MTRCIFEMPSYTYAQKAEKLLRARGIAAEVKRRKTGCGYVLHVGTDCRSAVGILEKYAVPYVLRERDGE